MEEIMSRVKCYIKGEESNADKVRDVNERGNNSSEQRRNYNPPPTQDRGT